MKLPEMPSVRNRPALARLRAFLALRAFSAPPWAAPATLGRCLALLLGAAAIFASCLNPRPDDQPGVGSESELDPSVSLPGSGDGREVYVGNPAPAGAAGSAAVPAENTAGGGVSAGSGSDAADAGAPVPDAGSADASPGVD